MSSGSSVRWILSGLCALAALAATTVSDAQEPVVDPPGRVARLSLIEGEVSVAPSGSEEWAEAVLNRPLTSGDTLWVDKDGRAELQVGSSTVHLDHDTSFGFIELDDDVMQMSLTGGRATLRVHRLGERESISIETPNGAVRINRVGEYNLEVDPETDRTTVKTRSGEAVMVANGASHLVQANEAGVFTGLDRLVVDKEPIGPRTEFESWANERDRRQQNSESARYVSRDVIGYEDLDDHGEWINEPQYGYVWRPTYVAVDWAPYRYGRWAYIGPWGWSWIDDAHWGFAPFHYGRWVSLHHRWCWVPGPRHIRPVYAPALVGWVGSPSLSVSFTFGSGVGWYPLGPREVYYPYYRHTPRYVRYVNVSNTVIVNNTYITNRNGRGHYDRGHGYRYRRDADAITAVSRDHFNSGRSLAGNRMRMRPDDLHQWRDDARPRGIEPVQSSLLAGQPRGRWASRDADRNREQIGRTEAKRQGDFHPSRTRMVPDDAKRVNLPQHEERRGSTPERVVRSEPRSDGNGNGRNGNGRNGNGNGNGPERLQVMPAQQSTDATPRRNDHMVRPPVQSLQPDVRSDGRIRTPERRSSDDFSFDRSRDRGSGRDHRDSGRARETVVRPSPPPQTQQPRFSQPRVQQPRVETSRGNDRGSQPAARQNDGGGNKGGGSDRSSRVRQSGDPKSRER